MYLEKHLQSEFMGLTDKRTTFIRTKAGGDEQDCISPVKPCFQQLVFAYYEILAENRKSHRIAYGAYEFQASPEILGISEY